MNIEKVLHKKTVIQKKKYVSEKNKCKLIRNKYKKILRSFGTQGLLNLAVPELTVTATTLTMQHFHW